METINIADFCEQFESINPEVFVCLFFNDTTSTYLECRKRNVEFWAMQNEGLRFFITGSEVKSHGTFLKATTCNIERYGTSIDYNICDKKGKPLFTVCCLLEV